MYSAGADGDCADCDELEELRGEMLVIEMDCIDERVRFSLEEAVLTQLPEVQLIALFGSRAKRTATARSDWDLAVAKTPGSYEGMQYFVLQEKISELLEISFDKIDLIDLRTASPLLSFAIAREGKPLYESIPGTFRVFQVRASKVYADTAKVRRLQRSYIGFDV